MVVSIWWLLEIQSGGEGGETRNGKGREEARVKGVICHQVNVMMWLWERTYCSSAMWIIFSWCFFRTICHLTAACVRMLHRTYNRTLRTVAPRLLAPSKGGMGDVTRRFPLLCRASSSGPDSKTETGINFNDSGLAYGTQSTYELLRAYAVFRICSWNWYDALSCLPSVGWFHT